jgi:hypothetical protein
MFERRDRAYFLSRAEQEREIASNCGDRTAAIAHLQLAEEYERRARSLMTDEEAALAEAERVQLSAQGPTVGVVTE